jgi:hypothetical protein
MCVNLTDKCLEIELWHITSQSVSHSRLLWYLYYYAYAFHSGLVSLTLGRRSQTGLVGLLVEASSE